MLFSISPARIFRSKSSKWQTNGSHKEQQTTKKSSGGGGPTPASQRSCPGSLKRIKSPALTAQQVTYEAMRTIDMYLIRQIARSCMDHDMEQKIDLEIRLRELADQSLLEARNEIDVLEVEKSLLTSDQRMNHYASQLEQQRKRLSELSLWTSDSGRGSKLDSALPPSSLALQRHADVVGAGVGAGAGAWTNASESSPSFGGSSSASNSQSPSKLSPVSGQSEFQADNCYESLAPAPPTGGLVSGSQARLTDTTGLAGTQHQINTTAANNHRHHRGQSISSHKRARSNHVGTMSAKERAKSKQRQQLMQTITSLSNINCNMVLDQRASVSISEIRIPLMWRDIDHFKGRGDYKRYAVFCLLKIDSQIYDTQLITDVDRQMIDVTFDDFVVFHEIEHNFELVLEVYSCVYMEQFSLTSTPRKLKEKLTNSVSRAMGRRLTRQTASTQFTKELEAYDKSYRFSLIASTSLRLADASDTIKTHDLALISASSQARQDRRHSMHMAHNGQPPAYGAGYQTLSSSARDAEKNSLPLFGLCCCKLQVRPEIFHKNIRTGFLRVAMLEADARQASCTDTGTLASSGRGSDLLASATLDMTALSRRQSYLDGRTLSTGKIASCAGAHRISNELHWGLLRDFVLYLWPVDELRLERSLKRGELPRVDSNQSPKLTINVDKYARLLRVSNSSLTLQTHDGSFVLAPYVNSDDETGLVATEASLGDEMSQWLRSIEQFIYDSHIWGSVLKHYPPQRTHRRQSTYEKHNLMTSPCHNSNNQLEHRVYI